MGADLMEIDPCLTGVAVGFASAFVAFTALGLAVTGALSLCTGVGAGLAATFGGIFTFGVASAFGATLVAFFFAGAGFAGFVTAFFFGAARAGFLLVATGRFAPTVFLAGAAARVAGFFDGLAFAFATRFYLRTFTLTGRAIIG